MTFKGSVVIKRTNLLSLIQNQKSIFRAPMVGDHSKWHVWGRQISYETLLEGDFIRDDWDELMQYFLGFHTQRCWMSAGIDWLYRSSAPLQNIGDYEECFFRSPEQRSNGSETE